ncbi:NAD(P)/FAD-dependent oxidoreductase [Candidatus Woesearchaeota archaeon]|nr:NAD(P)/FAD-dependent oxidoreductase [Candidatus Woesearchaeota archaeon]
MVVEKYDVAVVGAGPGGLKAAETLAKNGKKVIVLEKNSIVGPKVCAGGLTTKDESLIDKSIIQRSFDSVVVRSKRQSIVIRDKKPFVYTTSRKDFGQWQLKQAEKAGAEVRVNSNVTKLKENSVFADGNEIAFDCLIGADGSNSIVRKFLGLGNEKTHMAIQYIIRGRFNDMEIIFDADKFGYGYAWVFPYKNYASIGCGMDLRHMKTSVLKQNFHRWLDERKIDYAGARFEAFLINYDFRGFEFGNKFLIGDAAGFTSGLSGEGIYSAMLSGDEVAKKIINNDYDCEKLNGYLKIKNLHEKILGFMERHRKMLKINQEIGIFLLRSDFIAKKAISLVTG